MYINKIKFDKIQSSTMFIAIQSAYQNTEWRKKSYVGTDKD